MPLELRTVCNSAAFLFNGFIEKVLELIKKLSELSEKFFKSYSRCSNS